MANYSHILFSRDLDRNLTWPAAYVDQLNPPRQVPQTDADKDDPYKMLHTGLFSGTVKDNTGKERQYAFYVPATMKSAGNLVFIFTDKGQSAQQAWQSCNWGPLFEKHEITGIFIAPDGDWDKEDPGNDLDCFLRIYLEAFDKQYFIPTETALYTMGFGTGAYMSALLAILYGSKFSAFAINGDCGFSEELFALLGDLPSDGEDAVKKSECPLPAWIIEGNGDRGKGIAADGPQSTAAAEQEPGNRKLLDFMKRANHSQEGTWRNDMARVWFAEPKAGELYLNSQCVNQVWYTEKPSQEPEELADRMLGFITAFNRWGGYGNGHIRLSRSEEELGLVRKDLSVDGLNRRFYVYEPTAYKEGREKKYPLVLAIHGFTATARYYAENSRWQAVAEERGFLLVFPSAYPHVTERVRRACGQDVCPPPGWNSSIMVPDENAQNELHYFEKLLAAVTEEYPVDLSRIYVSGHSNGSEMTQYLMRFMPQRFAAFAPIGGMEAYKAAEKVIPMPEDGMVRPVWYMMGERDMQDDWDLTPGGWSAMTVESLCRCNRADYRNASRYPNGIYHHFVAYNEERIPLVRYTGIEKWPHTVTPETSLMIWDEFFCKFRRNEDGTITYVG